MIIVLRQLLRGNEINHHDTTMNMCVILALVGIDHKVQLSLISVTLEGSENTQDILHKPIKATSNNNSCHQVSNTRDDLMTTYGH